MTTTLAPSFGLAFAALNASCVPTCVLTLAVLDWLQAFGVEPDVGDGAVQVLLTLGFAAARWPSVPPRS